MQPQFPEVRFVELRGYGISYAKTAWGTRLRIVLQLRNILIRIKRERIWLSSFLKENRVDGLISDNRYGFYHPETPSVFITHQLHINSGYGKLVDFISQKFLYKFINRFSECWVPDDKGNMNLAGNLSHPSTLPSIPVRYIGPLSRFTACAAAIEKKFDVLIIISGPEPQRSVFEKMILDQAAILINEKIALVRGLPLPDVVHNPSAITVFNHLDADRLNKLVCESELVICRSGYTTVMDMMKLKKKMIVVPTPGQPEQEYLANYLAANNYVLKFTQKEFDLQFALQKATDFTFNHVDVNMDEYKSVLKDFVQRISSLSPSSTY